jgi:hypothetical protein
MSAVLRMVMPSPLNRQLDWRVVDRGTLAVATDAGPRRGEVRLILDEGGDPVRAEVDDRPRLDRARSPRLRGSAEAPTSGS